MGSTYFKYDVESLVYTADLYASLLWSFHQDRNCYDYGGGGIQVSSTKPCTSENKKKLIKRQHYMLKGAGRLNVTVSQAA